MVLSAAGPLAHVRGFKLSDNLVDGRGIALDWMADRLAPQGSKAFPVASKIHLRDRNLFPLDVTPDINFGPIEQRLHPHVFAFARAGRELPPELGRLIFVIPFK